MVLRIVIGVVARLLLADGAYPVDPPGFRNYSAGFAMCAAAGLRVSPWLSLPLVVSLVCFRHCGLSMNCLMLGRWAPTRPRRCSASAALVLSWDPLFLWRVASFDWWFV